MGDFHGGFLFLDVMRSLEALFMCGLHGGFGVGFNGGFEMACAVIS